MEAVKHDADFAKKVGVPQKVGREFVAADKAKKKTRSERWYGKKG